MVPKGKSRWRPPRYLLTSAVIVLLSALSAGVIAGIIAFVAPTVPRLVVMATGAAGGAYSEYGEQYREILARQGVTLTVLHSRGSIENLAMLHHQDLGVNIAFVQSGLTDPEKSPDLVSLGTVSNEPLWIFWRGEQSTAGGLDQLRGKRISIGPVGSGMRLVALKLLAANEIEQGNTELLPFPPDEAAAHLIGGDIQAAIILASSDSPAVKQLLGSPNIGLISLTLADAYVARYPFLSKVVLPAGFADMAHRRPSANVEMVAVKASLVVRRELQSAVQYLLLDAAAQIHSHVGIFQKAGEFSSGEATDLPLSDSARHFYKSGMPFLQSYLPLWLAVLTEQLAILLIPFVGFVGFAYGLLGVFPAIYGWRVQRRIYRLYGELKLLELKLEDHSSEQRSGALLAELSGLENRVSHLRVPVSSAHMLYTLRRNIKLVSERLGSG